MLLLFIRRLRLEGKESLRTRIGASAPGGMQPQSPPKVSPAMRPRHPLPVPPLRAAFLRWMLSPLHPDKLIWVTARLILRRDLVSRMEPVASLSNLS